MVHMGSESIGQESASRGGRGGGGGPYAYCVPEPIFFLPDYDKGKCQTEFENYRSCKGFWNSVSWARRKEVGFMSTYYRLYHPDIPI